MARSIEERASFERVRYANCWEDADVLCQGLRPREGQRILSIASGGDNSLALLGEGAEVVAADLSPAQLAVVELKAAAIRELDHEATLAFLGVRPSGDRSGIYRDLRRLLSPPAREYWDHRESVVAAGLIHDGKFERYFHVFRTRVLPWVHRRRTVLSLLAERDEEARVAFYDRTWNTVRWRLMFRVFFSRFVMGRLGRDPEFFRYVEGSVAARILERVRYALTVLAPAENPYLEYILTGTFDRQLPRFLRAAPFHAIKERLDYLTLFRGSVEEAARVHAVGSFDGFNLSDVFEYLAPEDCRRIYAALLDAARPGARFAYWNMLAPRSCPPELRPRIRSLEEESRRLFAVDKAFFYSAFVLEEVA